MSVYLKNFGCPDDFTNGWKKLHVTKWILLWTGMALAVSGYYIGSTLIILDGGHQMWILCALFWGSAGVCIVAYSIALINLKKKLYNVHRSLKYEEKLNALSGSNFHNKRNGICTQRDKQISELLSSPCLKRKSFPWGLNKDAIFKGKYIGSNGAAKGMNGSYETVNQAETLNISDGMERKVSNMLSEYLGYAKQIDIFHELTKSFNAVADETSESGKILNLLEESSSAKFTKWDTQNSQLQNEIGIKDISNDVHFVFKNQQETGTKENIVRMFQMKVEISNSSQLSLKCELLEDPYYCKTLCEDGTTVELAMDTLVSEEQSKGSEEKFALEFASFATILLTDSRSDTQLSYDMFLKTEYPETVSDYVKISDKQFWLKIPMKRSSSKVTKKRCEPIIFKNLVTVSKNEPDIYYREIPSSAHVSESSANESTLLLADSKACRSPEIPLSALTFMEELPTILIDDLFISENISSV